MKKFEININNIKYTRNNAIEHLIINGKDYNKWEALEKVTEEYQALDEKAKKVIDVIDALPPIFGGYITFSLPEIGLVYDGENICWFDQVSAKCRNDFKAAVQKWRCDHQDDVKILGKDLECLNNIINKFEEL